MTNFDPPQIRPSEPGRADLGLSFIAIMGLALLGAPRVVLHDLDLIPEGTPLNALLVFLPPAMWIAVVLWKRVPNPFVTLVAVGAVYGVILALGHQVLWSTNFGDDPPQLGGNLADLDPTLQAAILRLFAAISSLFTGVIVGAVTGLIAWGLATVTRGDR